MEKEITEPVTKGSFSCQKMTASPGVEKHWHTHRTSEHPGYSHTYFSAVAWGWMRTRTGTWPGLWCWSGAHRGSTRVGMSYLSLLRSWRWVRMRAWTIRRARSWSRTGRWRWGGPARGWVSWPFQPVAWEKGMRSPSAFLLFQRWLFQRFLNDPFGWC